MALRRMQLRWWCCLIVMLWMPGLMAGVQAVTYDDYQALSKRLTALKKSEPDLVRVRPIAKSRDQRKLWLVEVGPGGEEDRSVRPAVLVVAGIEGNDLVGSSLALSWLETLVSGYRTDPNVATVLETTTFYVFPRLNPDAAEHFFETPRMETRVDGKPRDDDHDAFIDEDGPDDLNGDGLITWMRVEDEEGRYIPDPNESRLLIEADPLKGEAGRWRYLTEGRDNDGDELWNEDAVGGVNFNRNFPYDHDLFATDAGLHQVSEPPTRALADFVIGHPNIGIILTYGAADNLLKTPKGAAPERRKPMKALDEKDVPLYRVFGELYRETLGLKKELGGASEPGTFSDWMYFHRGRLSLAARPWSPALAVSLAKAGGDPNESSGSEREKRSSKKGGDEPGKEAREELKWFDTHAPEAFHAWTSFDHPDFPNQRVEIGGYAPFARTNPPESMLADLAAKHSRFLTALAGQLPRIGIGRSRCKHVGESVFEVEIHVENRGFLPTVLAHGERSREVHPTRIVMELEAKRFLSGTRTTFLPAIQGSGGTAEVRWTVHVPDRKTIRFEAVSMLAGRVSGVIDLTNTEIHAESRDDAEAERDDD